MPRANTRVVDLLGVGNPEEEGNCAICQEALSTAPTYALPECKHKFHTHCIVTWFRHRPYTGDRYSLRMGDEPGGKCPLCGNRGINNNVPTSSTAHAARRRRRLGWHYRPSVGFTLRRRAMESYYHEHEGPPLLGKVLQAWESARQVVRDAEDAVTAYRKSLRESPCNFAEAKATLRKLERTACQRKARLRQAAAAIDDFHIVPLIIPTPIDIN